MTILRHLGIRAAIAAFAVTVMAAYAQPARALTDEERAGARAAARAGEKAYTEKRWADAVDMYSRAEAIIHSPVHLLFIARARAQLGELVQARETYLKITREQLDAGAPDAFKSAQSSAQSELDVLEPRIPYLTVQIENAGGAPVSVTDQGTEMPAALVGVPRPVNPGSHALQATADGLTSEPQTVELAEGERKTVTLSMQAASGPAPVATGQPAGATDAAPPEPDSGGPNKGLRIGSYVGFGVGAAGIALGAVFIAKSGSHSSDADSLFESCNGMASGCSSAQRAEIESLDSDANSARSVGVAGFAVGGAGIATGVVLLILSNKGDSSETASQPFVRPYAGLTDVGLYGRF